MFGAHHDAITGTEGDQVYLDLLAGWREAHERGDAARRAAAAHLAGLAATAGAAPDPGPGTRAVVVFNTLSVAPVRAGPDHARLPRPGHPGAVLRDDTGRTVPAWPRARPGTPTAPWPA